MTDSDRQILGCELSSEERDCRIDLGNADADIKHLEHELKEKEAVISQLTKDNDFFREMLARLTRA